MPKVKISEYSATANSNTDVASINIDEGCAPSGINNAIRAIMGHLKDFQQGTNGDPFNGPVNGNTGAFTTLSATGVTTVQAGTAALPAITTTGDTNTGIWFPAADTIAFTEGGVESMRINASGNLGLGVAPSAWGSGITAIQLAKDTSVSSHTTGGNLFVNSNTYYDGSNLVYSATRGASQYQQNDAQHIWYQAASGTAGNTINFTQAMTLDASGRLGIGTTTPTAKLATQQTSAGSRVTGALLQNVGSSASTAVSLDFAPHESSASPTTLARIDAIRTQTSNALTDLVFSTFNATLQERARIDSSGNLLVGTTDSSDTANAGFRAQPSGVATSTLTASGTGDSTMRVYSTGAGAYRFFVRMDGTIFATSIVITAISDQRLKENVRDIDTGLNSIMALKPRRFDWKDGKGQDKKNAAGFIAQEFETVFPECVGTSKAGADGIEYKSINHETLIPTLVKAIQEQQALITQLTTRITALESA